MGYRSVAVAVSLLNAAPPAAGAELAQVVPLDVRIFPEVLGATNKGADVPLPSMTLFAVRVARLVPPDATPKVPARVTTPVVAVLGVKPLNDV